MLIQVLTTAILALAPLQAAPASAPPTAFAAAPAPLRPDQTAMLREALARAGEHGLNPDAFVEPGLDELLAAGDADQRARGEAALLRGAAAYARALRSGVLRPDQFQTEWALRPAAYDGAGELRRALTEDRLAAWLQSLAPAAPAYDQLKEALARYRALAAMGGWGVLAAAPAAKPGADDDRAPALRKRLAMEYGLSLTDLGPKMDPALVEALKLFQRRHALAESGALDRATLAALNVPVGERINAILANLERRRWAARNPAATRIDVDIAAQTLVYVQDGVAVLPMRAIVGRSENHTPMFDDQVESVVLNPPWNVPTSIAVKEILPKLAKDPNYLVRNDFVVQPGPGPVSQRLQQKPGPKSALGLYKFDLPNRFDVYLHDTPSRGLFARDARLLSHGCVRVEKPDALARALLAGEARWDGAGIDAALASGVTTRAVLSRPVPVSIGYWTVVVDSDGGVVFRRDAYGWDAELIRAIGPGRLA